MYEHGGEIACQLHVELFLLDLLAIFSRLGEYRKCPRREFIEYSILRMYGWISGIFIILYIVTVYIHCLVYIKVSMARGLNLNIKKFKFDKIVNTIWLTQITPYGHVS